MSTFIRLGHSRFLFVVEPGTDRGTIEQVAHEFTRAWPESRLTIIAADEYHDASGEPIEMLKPGDLR